MRLFNIVGIAIILSIAGGTDLSGQNALREVLESVESNNVTLQAMSKSVEARSLEARMGNTLEDTSFDYSYMKGDSPDSGWSQEFSVSQGFEMPWVYANRSKLAGNLSRQYDTEYSAVRQEILLEAKQIYIELQSLYAARDIIEYRIEGNERVRALYERKFEAGDATILEKSKVEHEILLLNEYIVDNGTRIAAFEHRLASLNGGEPIEIAYNSATNYEELMPLDMVYEDYMSLSPIMELSRLREVGADYDVKVSRSAAYPKISIGYKLETSPGERFNGVTAGVNIPVFSNRHNVRRARAEAQAATLETRSTAIELRATLESLYSRAEILRSSLKRYEKYDTSAEYLRLLHKALELGEISVIDYYAESYSYYGVAELKIRLEAEYNTIVAQIHSIYL